MVKLIDPNVELYKLHYIKDITKHIEKCGRICYKSENNITEDSADKFIAGILKSGHESVIEHANLIFRIKKSAHNNNLLLKIGYLVKGINITDESDKTYVLSGNMRAFRDIFRLTGISNFNDYFKSNDSLNIFYIDNKPIEYFTDEIELIDIQDNLYFNTLYPVNHCYITAHFVCDLGVYKDITRHRLASFSIESTRYCNYSKDKFGNKLNIIKPINIKEGTEEYKIWLDCMNNIENSYMQMASLSNIKADQLRMMLPHSVKADVIMTANALEWKHIFNLRCAKQAHPSVRQIMLNLLNLMYKDYPNLFNEEYELFKDDIEEFKF